MARADFSVSGVVGAAGTAVLTFRPYGRRTNVVDQVSHSGALKGATSVGASALAILYKNGRFISRTIATGGTIDGPPPVTVQGADVLTLEYTGAVVGAAVEATFFFDDGQPG